LFIDIDEQKRLIAKKYGVVTETGSRVLAFDCPWIQGRNDEGSGRTSHCIGGMFLVVEVLDEVEVLKNAPTASESDGSNPLLRSVWSLVTIVAAAEAIVDIL